MIIKVVFEIELPCKLTEVRDAMEEAFIREVVLKMKRRHNAAARLLRTDPGNFRKKLRQYNVPRHPLKSLKPGEEEG